MGTTFFVEAVKKIPVYMGQKSPQGGYVFFLCWVKRGGGGKGGAKESDK